MCLGEPGEQRIRQTLPPGSWVLSSPEVSSSTSVFYESGLAVTTTSHEFTDDLGSPQAIPIPQGQIQAYCGPVLLGLLTMSSAMFHWS